MGHLIAHRGHWNRDPRKQNSPEAVLAAFEAGWGIEIDLHVANGALYVGHGNEGDTRWPAEAWLTEVVDGLAVHPPAQPVLLDVKSKGLTPELLAPILGYGFLSCGWLVYLFDHELVDPSLPDRLPTDTRFLARCVDSGTLSDRLSECAAGWPVWAGMWLDQPDSTWVTAETIARVRGPAFVVSPELHHRPIELMRWREWDAAGAYVCTDLPHFWAALQTNDDLEPHDPWWTVRA